MSAAQPQAKAPQSLPASRIAELEEMGFAADSYRFQPADAMRRVIARRMTESFRDVPHFSLSVSLEVDAFIQAHRTFIASLPDGEPKPSLNDLLIQASALALVAEPAANASYTPEGLIFHQHADVAFAVAVEGGLITPIIRAAETKSVLQIATETKDMAIRARKRGLKPDKYNGGTFTLSNLGMFGVRSFTSILNPPQACILSAGGVETRPVYRGEELCRAQIMEVTLTCDHRSVDGAVGARWLAAFKGIVAAASEWVV